MYLLNVMHNILHSYASKIVLAQKYTNFIIQVKCNVTKCHNYDKKTSYREK